MENQDNVNQENQEQQHQDDQHQEEQHTEQEQHIEPQEESTEDNGEVNENEMELDLTDEEDMKKMEELVGKKVEESKTSSKRGSGNKGKKDKEKTETTTTESDGEDKDKDKVEDKADEKEAKVDLSSGRILEREIKKGTVTCPQFRIIKINDGSYDIHMAPELSTRTKELKFEKVGNSSKLVDAKIDAGIIAAKAFGEKFTHVDGNQTIEHEWYRFEMHKPGRDKDVTESLKISQAKSSQSDADKKSAKKAEDEAKKALKDAEAAKAEEESKAEEEIKADEENKSTIEEEDKGQESA